MAKIKKRIRSPYNEENADDVAYQASEGIPKRNLTDQELSKLADAILEFSQAMCGIKLYPYELEFGWRIIYSLLKEDSDEITALFSRQSGKTETTSVVVCGLMVMLPSLAVYLSHDERIKKFEKGIWCGIYAPGYEQSGIMWARMKARMYSQEARKALLDPDIDIDLSVSSENMTLPNGSFVDCGTAAPQAKIEGKTYHLLLLEECLGPDSIIETEDGDIRIEEVVRGGYVGKVKAWSHEEGRPVWARVEGLLERPAVNPCYRLEFEDGTVHECTGEHPWFIDGTGYVKTKRLYLNARVKISSSTGSEAVRDNRGVCFPKHGLQVDRPEAEGMCHVSEGVHSKSNESKAPYVFLRMSEGKETAVRLREIRVIPPINRVYDLKTGQSNFFASGILSHNCQDISNTMLRSSIHPMAAACVTGESLIPLEDGRMVYLSDMGMRQTACFDEDFKFKIRAPIQHIDSGVQPCIRMVLNSGKEITGTYDHPVVVKPRAYPRLPVWQQLQNVGVGMQIAVPREIPFFGDKSVGKGAARVLGMLVGDGSYAMDCSPAFSGEDSELHEFLRVWVEDHGGRITEDLSRKQVTSSGRIFREVRCVSDVEGSSKGKNPVINLLREGGVYGQTGKKKRIPSTIWTSPKEEVAAFLGGLVDTDGCVQVRENRRANIDVSQCNREILVEVSNLLLKFGIHCRIRETLSSDSGYGEAGIPSYRLDISDRDSVLLFIESIRLLVPRKHQALQAAKDILISRRSKRRASIIKGSGNSRKAVPLDNDLVWERVVQIEDAGKQRVYDLEMPDPTHNFVANGVVVHNTAGTLVKIGTCNRVRSDFYDACRRNKRTDVNNGKVRSKYRLHYEYDYTVAQKYNPRYRKYIQKEKQRLGEDSDDFRMKYRLHWLLERGMFVNPDAFDECGIKTDSNDLFITRGKGNRARKIWFKRSPYPTTYDPTTPNMAAAIDVGREDSTVVTVGKVFWEGPVMHGDDERYPIHIQNWLELQGDDHEAQHPQIVDFLKNYRISDVIVDATGKGDPVYARLASELDKYGIRVFPFVFTTQSKDIGYKVFNQELSTRRFTFPAGARATRLTKWQKFCSQMYDLQKEWRGQTMVVHKSKDAESHDDFCLSEDTEILTKRGWVTSQTIAPEDSVCTYNAESKELAYDVPSRIIHRDLAEEETMIRIQGDTIDQLVTDNHKMLFWRNPRGSEWVECIDNAESLLDRAPGKHRFPASGGFPQSCHEYSHDEIRLVGWMVTEGWSSISESGTYRKYSIAQSKKVNPEFLEEIEDLVSRMSLGHSSYDRKDGVRYLQFQKSASPVFDSLLTEGTHRIPRFMLSSLSLEEARLLLDTLLKGDGNYRSNRTTKSYWSSDYGLASDVHEVAFKAGVRSRILPVEDGYCVNIHQTEYAYAKIIGREEYSGRVWCVTVPSGFIVVRRNGKISISGNCDSAMMLCWLVNVRGTMEIQEGPNPFLGRSSKWIAAEMFKDAKAWYRNRMDPRARRARPSHRGRWD